MLSDKNENSKLDSNGNLWTIYSDLFLSVAVVFLIMFVFSLLSATSTRLDSDRIQAEARESLKGIVSSKALLEGEERFKIIDTTVTSIREKQRVLAHDLEQLAELADALENNRLLFEKLYDEHLANTSVLKSAQEEIQRSAEKMAAVNEDNSHLKRALDKAAEDRAKMVQVSLQSANKDTHIERLNKKLRDMSREVQALRASSPGASAHGAQKRSDRMATIRRVQQDLKDLGIGYRIDKSTGDVVLMVNDFLHGRGEAGILAH